MPGLHYIQICSEHKHHILSWESKFQGRRQQPPAEAYINLPYTPADLKEAAQTEQVGVCIPGPLQWSTLWLGRT